MKISDIMSSQVACCTADTPIRNIAQMMAENHCGEIPVCDDARKPIGVVTDRDLVCRVIALGKNSDEMTAADCMSEPVITATRDMSIEECARLMEQYLIRRLPIIDERNACVGIVAQADLATKAPTHMTAEVVGKVSQPTEESSAVAAA